MTVLTQQPHELPHWSEVGETAPSAPLTPSPAESVDEPRLPLSEEGASESPPALSPRLELTRVILVIVFVLTAGMVIQLTLVSSVQQRSSQQRLYDGFRIRLAEGTAPVGPVDADGAVYALGTAVAYLEIPELGVQQVVVSGTSSEALFAGPGHRRDTVLPGQSGASIIMGRNAAYGGPFGAIDQLDEGDRIMVTTGQGEFEYEVMGVRREGDPIEPFQEGESRLVLTSAAGPPYLPNGVLRVDATMADASQGPGRLFPTGSLPAEEDTMAGDSSQLWVLVLWLQALIFIALGSVWAWHRWGRAQAWVVFLPPLMLLGIVVSNQAARLLPNLL